MKDLVVRKSKKVSTEFNVSAIYQFIAMVFYLVIVRLPSIKYHWDTQQYMSYHQIAMELGITHDQFIFLWQNFHMYNVEGLDVQAEEDAETSDEDNKEEGNLYDKSIEHIQHDYEDSDEEDESENDEEIETQRE
eukprot:9271177-Ditylum_brightwellii.AAC.1